MDIILIGGKTSNSIRHELDGSSIFVEETFEKIVDFSNKAMEDSSFLRGVGSVVVLQYAFGIDQDIMEEFRMIQEILLIEDLSCDLYLILNDKVAFKKVQDDEEGLVYDKAKVLYYEQIYANTLLEVISGKKDSKAVKKKVDEEGNYVEKDLKEVDKTIELFFDEEVEEKSETEEELKNDISDNEQEDGIEQKKNEQEYTEKNKRGRIGLEARGKRGPRESKRENVEKQVKNRPRKDLGSRGRRRPENTVEPEELVNVIKGLILVTGDRRSSISTTAMNVAEVLSMNGSSVLLVDFDFRRRTTSTMYKEFRDEAEADDKVESGIPYVLVNPRALPHVIVEINDNLSMVGWSRKSITSHGTFQGKKMSEIINEENITNFMLMAKTYYDVVVVDMPFEQFIKATRISLLVDRIILTTSNKEDNIDNLFDVCLEELDDIDSISSKFIRDKSSLLLTHFESGSKRFGKVIDERLLAEVLDTLKESRMEIIGRINPNDVYFLQKEKNKRAVNLSKEVYYEYVKVLNNL